MMLNNKFAALSSLLAMASARSINSKAERPAVSRRWDPGFDKVRGVNLGSQFIVEQWMAHDEWTYNMGCGQFEDEWQCVQSLGQEAADTAFAKHWQSWITQDDITKIKSYGLNTVRIPVGYWIKEDLVKDDEYFPRGGLPYLDQLVGWAADADIKVIMVLHGAPGAQSPKQEFTGHVDYPGFYTAENYERANQFLEWMAERIHTNEGYRSVFMLEVLNEPIRTWEYPDLAADMIANFYPAAWSRIRAKESELGVAESNQLYIQMMGDIWGSGDPKSKLADTNFAKFDDHRYYKWDSSVTKTKDGYMTAACNDDRGDNIIGEWTISVADDVQDNGEFNIDGSPAEQVDWYQKFWAAQAQTFEKSGGWIFWSWKCDWIGGKDDWRWCYESAVAAGAIPKDASSASSISPC